MSDSEGEDVNKSISLLSKSTRTNSYLSRADREKLKGTIVDQQDSIKSLRDNVKKLLKLIKEEQAEKQNLREENSRLKKKLKSALSQPQPSHSSQSSQIPEPQSSQSSASHLSSLHKLIERIKLQASNIEHSTEESFSVLDDISMQSANEEENDKFNVDTKIADLKLSTQQEGSVETKLVENFKALTKECDQGLWVAISNNKIVAKGSERLEVAKEAYKTTKGDFYLDQVGINTPVLHMIDAIECQFSGKFWSLPATIEHNNSKVKGTWKIDTGANICTISNTMFTSLKLQSTSTIAVSGAGNTVQTIEPSYFFYMDVDGKSFFVEAVVRDRLLIGTNLILEADKFIISKRKATFTADDGKHTETCLSV